MNYVNTFVPEEDLETIEMNLKVMNYTPEEIEDFKNSKVSDVEDSMIDTGYRICSECQTFHSDGYFVEGAYLYYCSDECLYKNFTHEEYMELYELSEDGSDGAFWTTWEV